MKQVLNKAILPALVGVFLLGCYPAGPEYVEDLDVVYSSYDQEYDFVSQGTYSMPDKIVTDVKIDNGDTTYVYMKAVYATPILAAIDQNMTKLGWEKVSIANDPDVLVSPAAMSTTTVYYSYWYDWWYGGYYGGWGWYYPPYYSVSSYTTGSMIITIADPNVESAINKTPTVWISAANGLLTGYDDVNRAITGINQAFAQSPYLKTN
jgi:Domain of unknown function (DUF4136)